MFVVEHHRAKYVCRRCESTPPETTTHETAPLPPQPIKKGLAAPGLLSHRVTSKYADPLPLHRLEAILTQNGFALSRSNLSDWMAGAAWLTTLLYDHMTLRVLRSNVVDTDDTTVPVQDSNQNRG